VPRRDGGGRPGPLARFAALTWQPALASGAGLCIGAGTLTAIGRTAMSSSVVLVAVSLSIVGLVLGLVSLRAEDVDLGDAALDTLPARPNNPSGQESRP
jgi:hypothetical protein